MLFSHELNIKYSLAFFYSFIVLVNIIILVINIANNISYYLQKYCTHIYKTPRMRVMESQ